MVRTPSMDPLIKKAIEARKRAYAPYSKFKVGAAVEAVNGRVYTGCNIENASYGLAICAERVAIWKAVSDGVLKFRRIAVVADTDEPCPPCGACRQAMLEFDDLEIVMANLKGKVIIKRLKDLVPMPFYLKKRRAPTPIFD